MENKTDNELIAEFMGMQLGTCFGKKGAYKDNGHYEPDFLGYETLELYTTSWDCLMPVVEKIETLDDWYAINIDRSTVFSSH